MGAWLGKATLHPASAREDQIGYEKDLLESIVSPPDWETRSWLEYSFKREVESKPSSLSGSWVNLEFTSDSEPVHSTIRQSVSPALSMEDLSGGRMCADTEDAVGRNGQLATNVEQDGGLTLPELGPSVEPAGGDEGEEEDLLRTVFIETASLQTTPVHHYPKPFHTNRSMTFSGTGSEYTSPVHSIRSGSSFYSVGRPFSPIDRESSLTASLQMSSDAKEKGTFIAGLFQAHIETLTEEIRPADTAEQLYNLAILTTLEWRKSKDKTLDPRERARAIVHSLKKKLKYNPELFPDVYAALKKAGVKVVEEIKAEVRSQYPEDCDLTRSVSVLSRPELLLCSEEVEFSLSSQCDSQSGRPIMSSVVESLEEALREGHIDTARQILSKEASSENGSSLLLEACQFEVNVSVLNLLLAEASLDVNATTKHGRTPLHMACAALRACVYTSAEVEQLQQQRVKVETLLAHGADPTAQDKDGNTALHLATLRRSADTVGILLRHDTTCVNVPNRFGNTALHIACREGCVELLSLLCASGADTALPNRTKGDKTPLHYACSTGNVELVTALLDRDDSSEYINTRDMNGNTALHLASKKGHKAVIKQLIARGALKDIKNQDGKDPVDLAAEWERQKHLSQRSPWFNRRRRRSGGNLRRVHTEGMLGSADRLAAVEPLVESDCDETVEWS